MRPDDDLLKMVQGANPMAPPPPNMEEMPLPPSGPETMPPEMPMEEAMPEAPTDDPNLPKSAMVTEIQGNTVILKADSGNTLKVPIDAFPIPPEEGMKMVQAVVESIEDGALVALVGEQKTPVDLPLDGLQGAFNVGDYFWMPAPPTGPEELRPE